MNIRKSLRIIFRNKIYSLLNIVGLTIGITATVLIFLWVESKVNFNKAIPNSGNVYIAGGHYRTSAGEYFSYLESTNPLAETLRKEFPEVKRTARYHKAIQVFVPENTSYFFEEKGAFADSTLFDIIGMKFVKGDVTSVFETFYSIVISRSMAKKIYDSEDPIGKGLVHEGQLYQVTGVFEDLPGNTTFQFQWLIPFHIAEQEMKKKFDINEWGTTWLATYIELEPNADLTQLNEKLMVLPSQKAGESYANLQIFLYPLNKTLLYGQFKDGMEAEGGYIKTVRLFFLVGVLILMIACINFMNLSTARSQKRALEVGVRKTFGTKKKYLIRQFLLESGLITAIALLLSIGLVWLSLPYFNKLIDDKLSFDFYNPFIPGGLIAIWFFCTLLAGSYPALYLSSFNPVATIQKQKGNTRGSAVWIRQGLVVFQFAIAFILICTTYVIYLQIQLAQNRDIGLVKDKLITFPATKELRASHLAVLNELKNTGLVESSGFSSTILLIPDIKTNPWHWEGKDPNDDTSVCLISVSEGLIDAAGIKWIDGRDIGSSANKNTGVVINETLAKRMGKEGRIGGQLGQSPEDKLEIVGIVENFVFNDFYTIDPEPLMFIYGPGRGSYLFARLKPSVDTFEAIGQIQSVLRNFSPYHTFEPMLMTDRFKLMFKEDSLIEKLSALFAILAIFISCLGLLGLSAYSAEQRTKEIGVRKVLGAKITDILLLLGKTYIALLLISFAIGIPVSLFITRYYLKDYAYRIVLSWDIFFGVAVSIAFIALATVSFQSLRAAIANPVKSIKTE